MGEINACRVKLKPMDGEERKNYLAHVKEADEIFIHYGVEPSEDLLESLQEPVPGVVYYTILLKETNTMIGYVGIATWNNNLEFYVFKEYRRKGYAYEAVEAFVKAFFDGDLTDKKEENVVAETLIDNSAAIALLEKLGYQKQGVGIRADCLAPNHPVIETCVFLYKRRFINRYR